MSKKNKNIDYLNTKQNIQEYYLYDYNLKMYYFPYNNTYTTDLTFNNKNHKRYLDHPSCYHDATKILDISDESRCTKVKKKTILCCLTSQKNIVGYSITNKAIDKINKFIGYKQRLSMDGYIPPIDVICPHCTLIITLNRFCMKCGSELIVYFYSEFYPPNNNINYGHILAIPPLNLWAPHYFGYRNGILSLNHGSLGIFKLPYNINHPVWKKSSFYRNDTDNDVLGLGKQKQEVIQIMIGDNDD
jgi:hypothetical protein